MPDHKQYRIDAAIKLQKLILKNTGTIIQRDAAMEVVEAITLSVIKSMEHYLLQPHKLRTESTDSASKNQGGMFVTEHSDKVKA